MPTINAPCEILVTSKSARDRLRKIGEHFHSDLVDPAEVKCLRCHTEWDNFCAGYRTITCSNCYSDRVIITAVRLAFLNWGEHNGGEAEQRERFKAAEREIRGE